MTRTAAPTRRWSLGCAQVVDGEPSGMRGLGRPAGQIQPAYSNEPVSRGSAPG